MTFETGRVVAGSLEIVAVLYHRVVTLRCHFGCAIPPTSRSHVRAEERNAARPPAAQMMTAKNILHTIHSGVLILSIVCSIILTFFFVFASGLVRFVAGGRPGEFFDMIILPLIVSFTYPAIALLVWVKRTFKRVRVSRNRHSGRCTKCSYNLTGDISGRCPECGSEC
jgi:hypothetical protein